MPQAQNSLTPMDAVLEERIITFDFGTNLTEDETLTAVLSLTCVVVSGTDATPQSRVLSGSAIVDAAPLPYGTGKASAAVSVMVGTMVAGVTYLLQCVAQTSLDQHLELWQHLECVEPA